MDLYDRKMVTNTNLKNADSSLKYILKPKDFLSFDPPKPLKATIIFLLLVKDMPTRFQN